MDTQKQKALEHFATWLGLPFSESNKILARHVPRLSIELSRLASALYHPKGADRRDGGVEAARADRGLWRMARRLGLKPRAFWPHNRPYAICITHDIDRIFSTVHDLRNFPSHPVSSLRKTWKNLYSASAASRHKDNAYFNFDRLMALEASWGVPSAAYVLFEKRRPWFALKRRELQHVLGVYSPDALATQLQTYQNLGNEVGLHASFDSWNQQAALESELSRLRDLGVRKIDGVRNHYLNFSRRFSAVKLREQGLHYDSTMGFNFQNGFRCGTAFPFRMGNIWELPFHLMDSALRVHPDNRASTATSIQKEVRRHGGVLVVNWHFRVMNADTFPEEISQLDAIVSQGQRDGAWFTTPSELIRQWEYRTYEVENLKSTEPNYSEVEISAPQLHR